MTIVQQPDSLSFCGNLKDFIITGESELSFSLYSGSTILIAETYTAYNNKIIIPCKKVIEQQFTICLPDTDVFVQTRGVLDFNAHIGDTTVSFRVIKGGIGDAAEVSTVFLKSQFLTLQPQQKQTLTWQPEFLNYYTQEQCRLKLRAYFADGTNEEKYIADMETGKLYTIDLSFLKVNGKFEKQVGYYDAWIENTAGNRLTYIQRYILTHPKDNSQIYVFENTLGGLDSVCFTGLFSEKLETNGNITTINDESSDSDIDFSVIYEQNTGYIPTFEYIRWLRGFFLSCQRYHVTDSFRKIYIEESENTFRLTELNSYTFEFRYSLQSKYDFVTRNQEMLPELLEFPADDELFFLAPRLSEFPIAAIADDLVLPAQFSFENQWRRISIAAIIQAAISASIATLDNIDLTDYWKKEELVRDELYLKFLDKKISSGYADKAGNSEKWNDKQMSELLDQPVRKTDSVQFKQVTADNITTDEITSSQFVSGPLGHGYRINKNGEAEFQNLTIRGTFSVFELLIQQIRAVGGQLLVSSASIKTSLVEETPSGYKCFFNTENGKIPNPFIAGDQAIHQVFTGNSINRYWRLVTEIGTDYFLLSKTDCEAGSGIPSAGDEIMLLGNRTDESRQGAILISAYGNNTPFVAYYAGINSFSLSGKEIMREGNLNGIVDEDFGQLQGFGVYIQKAYIKGILRLMSGKTVEEVIQDTIAKIVDITASSQVFKYSDGYIGTPSPASIVLTALPRNFTPTSYQWQYLNGSTWTNISGATSSTYSVIPGNTTLFPSGTNVRTFRVVCDGDEKLADSFTLAKLADGAQGAKGDKGDTGAMGTSGADAYTVLLTNESHAFAGSVSAALAGSTSCAVAAYKGATQVAATIGSISGLPAGMTASITNNKTTKATITFTVTTSMTTASGTVNIPVTVDGKSFTRVFSYSIAFKGATGAQGAKGDKGDTGATGAAGKSIGAIINYYLATSSSSGVTTSTSGWTTTVQSVNATKKYLWNYEVIKYSDGTTASTSTPCIIGAYGDKGATGAQGAKGDKGDTGATGNGISGITEYYQVSASNTTAPTSWATTIPAMTATNKYLWNYEKITYTNGNTEETNKRVIGVYGDKGATGAQGAKGDKGDTGATGAAGKSIGAIINYYLATSSSSGVTTSTSGWTTTVQSVNATKKYLWNYEVIKYSDGTTASTSTPCIIGAYGDKGATGAQGAKGDKGDTGATGNGISGITEYYQVSASNTTAPTSWATTIPAMTATNKYLWNYEKITYTNGNTEETNKRVIGVYGDKGATGAQGAKGDKGDAGAQGIPGESINGKMLYKDPEFKLGLNGTKTYGAQNNGGSVTVSRIQKSSNANAAGSPYNDSDYCLYIKAYGGTSTNHLGGFYFANQSRANAVFIVKVSAKIPVGYTLKNAHNSYGTGGKQEQLTSMAGTGKYETYIFKVTCGSTGTFSTINHLMLSGPVKPSTAPLEWFVDYATVFDQTADGYSDIEITTEDSFAAQLGFTNFEELKSNAVDTSNGTLIQGGYINTNLIKVDALIAIDGFIDKLKTNILAADSIKANMLSVAGFNFADYKIYGGAAYGSGPGIQITSETAERSFKAYKDTDNYIGMYYNSATDWGIKGVVGGATYLQLGNINKIGGFEIGSTYIQNNGLKLSSGSIEYKKDKLQSNFGALYTGITGIATGLYIKNTAISTMNRHELCAYFQGSIGDLKINSSKAMIETYNVSSMHYALYIPSGRVYMDANSGGIFFKNVQNVNGKSNYYLCIDRSTGQLYYR